MIENKLKLTLNTLAILIIATLTINTASAQLHVVKEQTDNQGNIISEAGNVGIGTEFPADKLDVNGNINAGGGIIRTGGNGGSALQLGKTRNIDGVAYFDLYPKKGEGYKARFLANDNGVTHFSHLGTGNFLLQTWKNDSKTVFIHRPPGAFYTSLCIAPEPDNKTTNVGIGTGAPEERLHVNGNIKVNGDAYISGGGEWTGVSDKRTKKNINQYSKGLEEVLKINPVTYKYNGKAGIADTESIHIGLIAQEFAKIEPEAVKPFSHTEEGSNKTEEYFSLNASSIKYMLVNAIKEQQAKIESLEEKLEKMAGNGPVTNPTANEINVLLEGTGVEKALLAQNSPNPFTTSTRIEYFIPTNSRHCRMSFRDMSGKELKEVNIEHDGIGSIELSAKDLANGIYSYVLYVNGDIVASKKMILKQ